MWIWKPDDGPTQEFGHSATKLPYPPPSLTQISVFSIDGVAHLFLPMVMYQSITAMFVLFLHLNHHFQSNILKLPSITPLIPALLSLQVAPLFSTVNDALADSVGVGKNNFIMPRLTSYLKDWK